MFGIGFPEMILIAGIALVVIGPEKFPDFAKVVMRTMRDIRGYVDEARQEISKELKPMKQEMDKLSRINTEEYLEKLIPSDDDSDSDEDEEEKGDEEGASPEPDYGESELYSGEDSDTASGMGDDASESAAKAGESAPETIEYASEDGESTGNEDSPEQEEE